MNAAGTRWRLLELQRQRAAIHTGVDLLERKREALLRAITDRAARASSVRARVASSLGDARLVLQQAMVQIGAESVRGAAAAQPCAPALSASEEPVVGVRIPRLSSAANRFRIQYGPGGTCALVDRSARLHHALLTEIVSLAEEEGAERSLARGLRRTIRTLNALTSVLLPSVDAEIRRIEERLEEDEREEAIRTRRSKTATGIG